MSSAASSASAGPSASWRSPPAARAAPAATASSSTPTSRRRRWRSSSSTVRPGKTLARVARAIAARTDESRARKRVAAAFRAVTIIRRAFRSRNCPLPPRSRSRRGTPRARSPTGSDETPDPPILPPVVSSLRPHPRRPQHHRSRGQGPDQVRAFQGRWQPLHARRHPRRRGMPLLRRQPRVGDHRGEPDRYVSTSRLRFSAASPRARDRPRNPRARSAARAPAPSAPSSSSFFRAFWSKRPCGRDPGETRHTRFRR